MIVLEMPSNSLEMEIYGKKYSINITDFKALESLQRLPMPTAAPDEAGMTDITEQYQTTLAENLGERLTLPTSPGAAYFAARQEVVAVYWAIRDEQNKYLDINYRVKQDAERKREMLAEIRRVGKLAKPDAFED